MSKSEASPGWAVAALPQLSIALVGRGSDPVVTCVIGSVPLDFAENHTLVERAVWRALAVEIIRVIDAAGVSA